ncbi:MAG: SDR family oxidoreductase [Lachnospiraceae bacterium]|jgi:2-deoxy-D-gluconate 3-dehydrogenase|nr:SDR family oxidoreductase [Lachnospiraceae bacterium]
MVNFSLKGKTAVVTGGAQGLCNGIARAYHEAGATVVLVDVSDKVKEAASKMHTAEAPVYWAKGDLTDTEHLEKLVDECAEKLGGHIDILLNGAGIQFRCRAEDFPADRWESIIKINLSSVFFMAQKVGRKMLAQGHGKIINIASMCSFFGSTMIPAYSASKGGVAQLTKALSNEWAGRGVAVNAIAPGYMVTKLTENMKEVNPKGYEEITGRIPMGRWGLPEDLEGTAVFLASDASAYISGAIIPVDGGYLGK